MIAIWVVVTTLDAAGIGSYRGDAKSETPSGRNVPRPADRVVVAGHANLPDSVQPYEMFIPRRYLTKEFLLGKVEQAEDTAFVDEC